MTFYAMILDYLGASGYVLIAVSFIGYVIKCRLSATQRGQGSPAPSDTIGDSSVT